MTRFAWGAATDKGRVRPANEDALLTVDGLFVVADGMGGHRAGEVASHLAIETVQEEFSAAGTDVLVEAVERANDMLIERSSADEELAGMGTTLCAMALVDADGADAIAVVNVGDSRLYLLSDGTLTQITEDHSLVATLERQGQLTPAEAAVHPQRNILTRALGIDERVMVDSWEIPPVVGDRYLLCSDGLFNEVDDNRVAATLRRLADPGEAARELVRLANASGGRDNITCVVVDVVDDATAAGASRLGAGAVARPAAAGEGPVADQEDESAPAGPSRREQRRARREEASATGARRTRFTWRVGVFVVAFLLVVGAAFGVIWWVGNRTYYVGLDGQSVVIYQGRPGGVLWIQPKLRESTGLTIDQVPADYADAVRSGVQEGSLAEAERYVQNLRDQTTTTTTTAPPTTTTAPATTPAGG